MNSLVSSDGYVIYTEIGVWDFLCLLVLLKTFLVAPFFVVIYGFLEKRELLALRCPVFLSELQLPLSFGKTDTTVCNLDERKHRQNCVNNILGIRLMGKLTFALFTPL